MGRGLHKKTVELINFIKENILLDQQKSIRRIYYALEARQILESSDEAYQKVIYAMKMARFHGLIHPRQLLLDKARVTRSRVEETYLADKIFKRLTWTAYNYNINYWDISDVYIEVWQEKEGMEPEFVPVTDSYNVRLETGRGDQSITAIWNAMKRWDLFLSGDKKIVVLYFGDFNPSGLHAPVAIQNTIVKLRKTWKNEFKGNFNNIEFKRVALTLEHVKKYNLPQNPTKKKTHKDKVIAAKFIRKYGDINVEMESLAERQPDEFKKLIQTAVEKYVDEDAKVKADVRTEKVRAKVRKIIKEIRNDYFKEKWDLDFKEY